MVDNAVKSIMEWTWIHYKVKLSTDEALFLFSRFLKEIIKDNKWLGNLYGCMKHLVEDYLKMKPVIVNTRLN